MATEKIQYSMFKYAGQGWETKDLFIEISLVELDNRSLEIRVSQKDILLKKYFEKIHYGEVCNEFMWISSLPVVDIDSLIRYGFQRVLFYT